MATTDISLVNNVVKVTPQGGTARQFSLQPATYAFNERSELQLQINGSNFLIPLADLRIAGSGSAPASVAAALTSLSSTFPAWNQTTYTLNQILAASNNAGGLEITNAADPSTAQSLVTKAYGDANYAGGGGGSSYLSSPFVPRFDGVNLVDGIIQDTGDGVLVTDVYDDNVDIYLQQESSLSDRLYTNDWEVYLPSNKRAFWHQTLGQTSGSPVFDLVFSTEVGTHYRVNPTMVGNGSDYLFNLKGTKILTSTGLLRMGDADWYSFSIDGYGGIRSGRGVADSNGDLTKPINIVRDRSLDEGDSIQCVVSLQDSSTSYMTQTNQMVFTPGESGIDLAENTFFLDAAASNSNIHTKFQVRITGEADPHCHITVEQDSDIIMELAPFQIDQGSNIAYLLGTNHVLAGSTKLMEVNNNGVSKFSVFPDGSIGAGGDTNKWILGAASGGAPTPDSKIRVTINGTNYDIAADAV